MLPNGNDFLHSCILRMHGRTHDIIAPPTGSLDIIQRERKKNEERAQRKSEIKTTARKVVKTRPPAEIASSDDLLEDEAYNTPRKVVQWCCRRD